MHHASWKNISTEQAIEIAKKNGVTLTKEQVNSRRYKGFSLERTTTEPLTIAKIRHRRNGRGQNVYYYKKEWRTPSQILKTGDCPVNIDTLKSRLASGKCVTWEQAFKPVNKPSGIALTNTYDWLMKHLKPGSLWKTAR